MAKSTVGSVGHIATPLRKYVIKPRFSIAALLLLTLALCLVMGKWRLDSIRENKIERGVLIIADRKGSPLDLIHAVNHLHSLGHADAIEVLRRFANRHPLEAGQTEIFYLEILIPLLFVPKETDAKLPSPDWDMKNWRATKDRYLLDRDTWQLPIELVGDIPFHTDWRCVNRTGFHVESTYLIEWASVDGRLRDSQLTPSDDPFRAALVVTKNLMALEGKSANTMDEKHAEKLHRNIENHMYEQVFAMISDLVPEYSPPDWNDWSGNKPKWNELVTICKSRGLHWDCHDLRYCFAD